MISDILFGAIAMGIVLALVDECVWLWQKRKMRREQDAMWKRIAKQLEEPK